MTNKTKASIDEAATKSWEDDAKYNPNPDNPYAYRNGFKAGAKEVIEHPERYGLITREEYEKDLQDAYNQGATEAVHYVNKNILK